MLELLLKGPISESNIEANVSLYKDNSLIDQQQATTFGEDNILKHKFDGPTNI